MALGKVSSLGIGSSVLNHDVIDKLRAADEDAMVAPVDKKIDKNVEKQTELASLTVMLGGLRGSSKTLADYSTYLARSSSVNSDSLTATVGPGVPIQNISIDVESIAKSDINQVGTKFESRDSVFTQKDTSLKFFTQGRDYSVKIAAGDTLEDVAQKITDATNGSVMGVIMKTGGINPYQLMINSKESGDLNRIFFGSTVKSANISEGSIALEEGDLNISIRGSDGSPKNLSIVLPKTEEDSSTTKNTALIKDAVYKAISEDSDLSDLLEDGTLNVEFSDDGKSFIINDKRGYDISIDGAKKDSAGFAGVSSSESEEIIKSLRSVEPGHIKGTIRVGSVPLNLSEMTKEGNTSYQNATIIAEAIENIAGMHAKASESGFLSISSEIGEIVIMPDKDDDSQEALKKIGINQGTYLSYAKSQEDLFRIDNLQSASDAKLVYNGTSISRPTNKITVIVSGVTIDLVGTTEPNKPAVISIKQDQEEIIKEVEAFVDSYNELIPKLDELTKYDEDTRIAGIFNGESSIRSIRSSLSRLINHITFTGSESQSLIKYGLMLNDNGTLAFDKSKLTGAISENPESTREFFQGSTKFVDNKEVVQKGIFKEFQDELDGLIDGSTSRLKLFEESLVRDDKKFREDRRKSVQRLDTKYGLMAERFAAYDSQIAAANRSFEGLNMQIQQAVNGKK